MAALVSHSIVSPADMYTSDGPAVSKVAVRVPQSAQSVPYVHEEYSEPTPPSSHSPLLLWAHAFEHRLMRRKSWPASTS